MGVKMKDTGDQRISHKLGDDFHAIDSSLSLSSLSLIDNILGAGYL